MHGATNEVLFREAFFETLREKKQFLHLAAPGGDVCICLIHQNLLCPTYLQ